MCGGRTPGGRNERIYENTCRIMMRRFPPGERKINYTHIINGRNVFVKRNGSRRGGRKPSCEETRGKISCEAPGGVEKMRGIGGPGETCGISLYGTWGNGANNAMVRFGKLAKSRAIDGCTPAPFFRWYNVSRGT